VGEGVEGGVSDYHHHQRTTGHRKDTHRSNVQSNTGEIGLRIIQNLYYEQRGAHATRRNAGGVMDLVGWLQFLVLVLIKLVVTLVLLWIGIKVLQMMVAI
jgi:hypothetical protein